MVKPFLVSRARHEIQRREPVQHVGIAGYLITGSEITHRPRMRAASDFPAPA
jgi:hypothetical protein